MNDLDLPPSRTLPSEVRDRIRTAVNGTAPPSRHRAPLSVAAAVAVLAIGAVIIGQSTAGTPDGFRPGTTSTGSAPPSQRVDTAPPLVVTQPDARTNTDLDRCGTVVAASPRAHEFPPRSAWVPMFTAEPRDGLTRVIAFREFSSQGKPGFCEITRIEGTTATESVTVSDPSAETMALAADGTVDIYALYLSNSGMLAGVAQGVTSVEIGVTNDEPGTGARVRLRTPPVLQNELFVAEVGGLTTGSVIDVGGIVAGGNVAASGEWSYDPAKVRPVGATGDF
jgi:hypothetical protein